MSLAVLFSYAADGVSEYTREPFKMTNERFIWWSILIENHLNVLTS